MTRLPPTRARLSLVTVTYPLEFPLQRLQARSVERFVSPEDVDEVVVVVNAARTAFRRHAEELRGSYGSLAPRVRVVHRDEVTRVPRTTGWRAQQVLKLAVARSVAAPHLLVLDSKNHFVAPLRPEHFVTAAGEARTALTDYRDHPLRPNVERVLDYVGLDRAEHLPRFSATVTPFVLDTATVRALLDDLEAGAGRAFAREFVARDLTEFPLYAAWSIAHGRSTVGRPGTDLPRSPTVWPRGCDAEAVRAAFDRLDAGSSPVFGVHRRALQVMDEQAVAALVEQWVRRGVFDSAGSARVWLAEFRSSHASAARRRTLTEAPLAALGRARRVLGRARARPTASASP